MRIERELPEIFEEFGEQRKTSFLEIKEYKDRGIPVVGMYCAYFPPELAIAAGEPSLWPYVHLQRRRFLRQSGSCPRACARW